MARNVPLKDKLLYECMDNAPDLVLNNSNYV